MPRRARMYVAGMPYHVHLLMTPEDLESISRLTRVLGSRFAQYVNKQYGRTGTLWEGRHKSSLVDADSYLLKFLIPPLHSVLRSLNQSLC